MCEDRFVVVEGIGMQLESAADITEHLEGAGNMPVLLASYQK
jgi:hypothetical protein